jgi:hypothetical protein
MHALVRSPLSAGVAVAVAGAVVVAPPPPVLAPAPVVAQYRLAADPVPIGGLVTSFLGNQLIYCSIICPDVVKLAVTVPAGAAAAPVVFVTTLASGNAFKAVGAAVASVTNPLDAAFDPIITNDLNLVLPRAQNALEVGVVGLLNIATAGPLGLVGAIQTARQNTFDALNDTIPPSQTSPNPHGLIQVVAVEAINVASSIVFQAFEEGLLGIVQTADAAATTLAQTGDPLKAFVAGETAAFASFGKTLGFIGTATHNAVVNIAAALHDPMPAQALTTTTTTAKDAALAAATTASTAGEQGPGQQVEKSTAITPTRDGLVNQDKSGATATTAVKSDTPKRPIRDALAKIRQAFRGQDKATSNDANATSKANANGQGKTAATTNDTAGQKAKANGGKDDTPKAKQHHQKQHKSAGAANG